MVKKKNSLANAGDARDAGLIPGLGRSPGEGNSNPLQYSCMENSMDKGAWWATTLGSHRVGHEHHHQLLGFFGFILKGTRKSNSQMMFIGKATFNILDKIIKKKYNRIQLLIILKREKMNMC